MEGNVLDTNDINAAIVVATSNNKENGKSRLDILVNNAARLSGGHNLLETSENEWDDFMSVNVKGAFLCSQLVVLLVHQTSADHKIDLAVLFHLVAICSMWLVSLVLV